MFFQLDSGLLAAIHRRRFAEARSNEDPEHPAVIDVGFEVGTFPEVHDPTGRFIRPDIATIPTYPLADFFRLPQSKRYCYEETPILCDGKIARISAKRVSRRMLFAHGRYVIKVGVGSFDELHLQSRLREADRKHFVPIVAYGRVRNDPYLRTWVASPVVRVRQESFRHTLDEWRRAWEKIWELGNRYHIIDLTSFEMDGERPNPKNWTVTSEGIPIVYDYGAVSRTGACAAGTCEHLADAPVPEIVFR